MFNILESVGKLFRTDNIVELKIETRVNRTYQIPLNSVITLLMAKT